MEGWILTLFKTEIQKKIWESRFPYRAKGTGTPRLELAKSGIIGYGTVGRS